ncbi:uncharacterized protein LOC130950358 [Arachis stenosperma]|uniref:uncharacterized protein LOC130950358 n=1 Tax=Arachis stenosperma TaxID=217475 RepID=UPI0025ABAA06|nr:uncharacterized protein LOC130950358 [Arachis stenosperma]
MTASRPGTKLEQVEVSQSDVVTILYSSETTGKVKGVMLTHRNLIAKAWFVKMGNQVSSNLKYALLLETSLGKMKQQQHSSTIKNNNKVTIDVLSFEVANVMSKTVHLHKSLSDSEMSRLRNEILTSEAVRSLVSSDHSYLLDLALVEKVDKLNRVASVVSRLGKKCFVPALQGFEHVYGDIVSGVIDVNKLGFLVKHMEGMVRKMDRYVSNTKNLYSKMEVLNQLEQAMNKFQNNQNVESRRIFEHKLTWQRQDVRHQGLICPLKICSPSTSATKTDT